MMAGPSEQEKAQRIAYLKQRQSELQKVVAEQAAQQESVVLRLPADVLPGQRCDAVLPNGVRIRFVAPAGAEPGQLVRIKAPAVAQDDDEDDDDEEYDDDDDEEEDGDDDDVVMDTMATEEEDDDDEEEEVVDVAKAPKAAAPKQENEVSKALLTSLFGESKADREKREAR